MSVGFCGLDKRRLPLTGRELRGCWTAAAPLGEAEMPQPFAPPDAGVRLRGFVPIEQVARSELGADGGLITGARTPTAATGAAKPALPTPAFDPAEAWANRATLFGDAEG